MSNRQLRPAALRRMPGRYREDDGPTRVERPAFVHPDVPFNARLVEFCAHPTLPLDYPGVGPAEAERLRLAALAAAEQADIRGDESRDSDDGRDSDDSDNDEAVLVANIGAETQDQSNEERAVDRALHPAAGDGPVASHPVAPIRADVEQGGPARPAYVANIPRRQPGKINESGEAPALPPSGLTPSPTIYTNPAAEAPNWSDLSDGIKYAIVFEMTRGMALSEALQQLNLTYEEIQSFLVLVQKEREKVETCDAKLGQLMDFDDPSVRETIAALAPITDPLTAAEVRGGRSYVRLLGIDRVAENLCHWEGTAGTWHPIDIDEGCLDLLGVPNLGGVVVGLVGGSSNQLLSNMTDAELLVRLDPPANTLNPQRLRSGAPPAARGRACDPQRVPKSGSSHPANFVYTAKSGRQYSTLDKTDWPQWEALHDAGMISQTVLTVATMQSEVPDEVSYLSREEVDAMDVDRPEELLGSLPAPDQDFIDAVAVPELPAGRAQDNESQIP